MLAVITKALKPKVLPSLTSKSIVWIPPTKSQWYPVKTIVVLFVALFAVVASLMNQVPGLQD